jgi:hypothetical protein
VSRVAYGAADLSAQEPEHGLLDGDWMIDHRPMAAVIEDDDFGLREGFRASPSTGVRQIRAR